MPENHELDSYGIQASAEGSSSSRPLLSRDPSPPPSPSRRGRPYPVASHGYPSIHSTYRRLWKPIVILSIPFLLVFLYSLVHPHVKGLPPLPKISITSGGAVSQPYYEEKIVQDCICGATDEGKRLCSLYHEEGLRNSRLIEGTGARIRKVLQKARNGEKIKIGVLGGSVSACHGVHPSDRFPQGDPAGPGCYTSLLMEWFKKTFPDADHEFMNGAIGGMDSSYYAFCGTHHIAADSDLIILEFDVNDQNDVLYETFFDQLLRALSEFQNEPAILILGAWAPQIAQDQGYGDPQVVHSPIALYYDVPYLSMKRVLFSHYLRYPHSTAKTFFQPDLLHPNARGHRILSDLLIAYLDSELCMLSKYGLPIAPPSQDIISTTRRFTDLIDVAFPLDTPHLVDPATPPEGWEETFKTEPLEALSRERRLFAVLPTPYSVPPVGMFTPLRDVVNPTNDDPITGEHITTIAQPRLFCADANDKKNPMKPTQADGWEPFAWNGEKHYWVSHKSGSRIRVDIKVNAGKVAVYYFRSQHYNLGDAKCWVDDNEKGAVTLSGYWTKQYNVAVAAYIDEKVTPGDHYVICEVLDSTSHPTNPEAHHFRLTAVMAT
ncbi:hypothetical protein C361_02228 [Cryptococcus neoformans Tu259-1]|uniref:SGNH hydrolase-type esterase domain-containing protein n=1 Tax=Cryptococcus neoformans Tu259-1 TaxID=1230072 RepID=A0A854QHG3_CRYNE|nr:hypothetical protein AYX13_05528 [Cryptococcus neoformans var. grubii]OXG25224.1 hypothetical protein C361_02228 [Cryptococcus neoformans var. grubii Tu259-1]